MKMNLPDFAQARYFSIPRAWHRLGPLFRSRAAAKIWKPCLREFDQWRAERYGREFTDHAHKIPAYYDSCDWRFEHKFPHPEFWDFACHSACHWVADLALYVAMRGMPEVPWRVTTSRAHTTIWNGVRARPVLFDINFSALRVAPAEALELACRGRELKPGVYLKPYLHPINL